MTEREAKAFLNNLKVCIEEHPIVADWLVEIENRKTESNSEKPNNCETEPQREHRDCINCESADDCAKCRGFTDEPNSSEIPNNCEHITEDGVTCAKYPACDDCPDNPLNKVKGSERLVKGKDEPQTDCLTCRYNSDEWDSPKCDGCSKAHSNYEPQTERYCTNCKHNGVIADYECRECCGMDHHEFIEPQTDCAWKKGE